jgi:hypothetical protein
LDQYDQGIWTQPPFSAPKWVVSVLIPYGMLSAGLYFLRQLLEGTPLGGSEGTPL